MCFLVLADDQASGTVAGLSYRYLWVMRIWGLTTRNVRVSVMSGEISSGIRNQADSFGGRSSVMDFVKRLLQALSSQKTFLVASPGAQDSQTIIS